MGIHDQPADVVQCHAADFLATAAYRHEALVDGEVPAVLRDLDDAAEHGGYGPFAGSRSSPNGLTVTRRKPASFSLS